MENFLNHDEVAVERDESVLGIQEVKLCDQMNFVIHTFLGTWTDAQIMQALDFANKIYQIGLERGRDQKAAEIRELLKSI